MFHVTVANQGGEGSEESRKMSISVVHGIGGLAEAIAGLILFFLLLSALYYGSLRGPFAILMTLMIGLPIAVDREESLQENNDLDSFLFIGMASFITVLKPKSLSNLLFVCLSASFVEGYSSHLVKVGEDNLEKFNTYDLKNLNNIKSFRKLFLPTYATFTGLVLTSAQLYKEQNNLFQPIGFFVSALFLSAIFMEIGKFYAKRKEKEYLIYRKFNYIGSLGQVLSSSKEICFVFIIYLLCYTLDFRLVFALFASLAGSEIKYLTSSHFKKLGDTELILNISQFFCNFVTSLFALSMLRNTDPDMLIYKIFGLSFLGSTSSFLSSVQVLRSVIFSLFRKKNSNEIPEVRKVEGQNLGRVIAEMTLGFVAPLMIFW